jgi:hypothetical protein
LNDSSTRQAGTIAIQRIESIDSGVRMVPGTMYSTFVRVFTSTVTVLASRVTVGAIESEPGQASS